MITLPVEEAQRQYSTLVQRAVVVSKLKPKAEFRIFQTLAALTVASMRARTGWGSLGQAAAITANSGNSAKSLVALLVARGGRRVTLDVTC
jgi:hypothetical protein